MPRFVIFAGVAFLFTAPPTARADDYFPPPESQGGWRRWEDRDGMRQSLGVDPQKLDDLRRWLLQSDDRNFAAVVVRHGWIVLEVERGNSARTDARRVASVSKAVCATVLAVAAERSAQGRTPRRMAFDDKAFDFLPQARPLSDPRKAQITVKQLLNHTSGLTPEQTGAKNVGPWRHVLGHDGDPLTEKLAFDPGTRCGYSTFGFYHAALVCENVTGKPYDEFAVEALFKPIGVERYTFEYFQSGDQPGDADRYGRHASHSLGMPARDLARIAYCLLREGRWRGSQVVPRWFVEQTAAPTHDVHEKELRFGRDAESFSHGWELPARLTEGRGAGIPVDARSKPGSGGQLAAFVPSLDLVITRQTGASGTWQYEEFLRRACACVARGPK
jgi:CubicO group peptidase (beta-lactamase class C family)